MTPLLLAAFCGRYDVALTLLTKGDASPFARDHIHLKNILDYTEIDQARTTGSKCQHEKTRATLAFNRESVRQRLLLHQVFVVPPAPLSDTHDHHHLLKNFFEDVLPQAVRDRSGWSRLTMLTMFRSNQSSTHLTELVDYIHQRYPQISPSHGRQIPILASSALTSQCGSAKESLHEIIRLFDPDLRPKAMPPKELMRDRTVSHSKTPITFKRLGAKVAVVATFPRHQTNTKAESLTVSADAT